MRKMRIKSIRGKRVISVTVANEENEIVVQKMNGG